jgi:uncharacterized lipoprotein YajG
MRRFNFVKLLPLWAAFFILAACSRSPERRDCARRVDP